MSLYRPKMPDKIKQAVLSNQCGLCASCGRPISDIAGVEYDHRPPLWLRPFEPLTRTYTPGANDPAAIDALCVPCHRPRTDGDATVRAKGKRVAGEHQEFLQRRASREPRPKGKMRSRGFVKREKPKKFWGLGERPVDKSTD